MTCWFQYVFADTLNSYIFTTRDMAHTLTPHRVDFPPASIVPHKTNADILLAYDEESDRKPVTFELYISAFVLGPKLHESFVICTF